MPPRPSRQASTAAKLSIAQDAISDPLEGGSTAGTRRKREEGDSDDEPTFSSDSEGSTSSALSDVDDALSPPPSPPPKLRAKPKAKAAAASVSPFTTQPSPSASSTATSPSSTASSTKKPRAKLPPYEIDPLTGEPLLDTNGKPVKRIPRPRKKAEPVYELGEDGEPLIGSDGEKIIKKKGAGRKPKEVVVYEVPEVEHKKTTFRGRLGYACLNSLLRARKPADKSVFTSRTMRLATFESELGQQKLHDLTAQNTKDLCEILQWNADNNIFLFRLSSEMFPFASHPVHGYSLSTLPRAMENLQEAGRIAKKYNMRLTCHPGQWTQLASPRQKVIDSAVKELIYHCEMLDAIGCDQDSVMVIHMGGVYDDKAATLERFKENYVKYLPDNVKARLVLENDEICYNVHELLPICQSINIPLVLDYHHDWINPSPLPPAILMPEILETWSRKGIRCKQHLSEGRPGARTVPERRGHSDRCSELPLGLEESVRIIREREVDGLGEEKEGWKEEGWVEGGEGWEEITEFGHRMGLPDDVDLMIEAKDKEQAVLHLYNIYQLYPILNTSYLPPKPQTTAPDAAMDGEDDGAALVDADGNPVVTSSVKGKVQTPMARAKKEKAEAKVAAGKRREEKAAAKALATGEEPLPAPTPLPKKRKSASASPAKVKLEDAVDSLKPTPAKKRKTTATPAVVVAAKEEEVSRIVDGEDDLEGVQREVERRLEVQGLGGGGVGEARTVRELEERMEGMEGGK